MKYIAAQELLCASRDPDVNITWESLLTPPTQLTEPQLRWSFGVGTLDRISGGGISKGSMVDVIGGNYAKLSQVTTSFAFSLLSASLTP